jgi:hypothetical protein
VRPLLPHNVGVKAQPWSWSAAETDASQLVRVLIDETNRGVVVRRDAASRPENTALSPCLAGGRCAFDPIDSRVLVRHPVQFAGFDHLYKVGR